MRLITMGLLFGSLLLGASVAAFADDEEEAGNACGSGNPGEENCGIQDSCANPVSTGPWIYRCCFTGPYNLCFRLERRVVYCPGNPPVLGTQWRLAGSVQGYCNQSCKWNSQCYTEG